MLCRWPQERLSLACYYYVPSWEPVNNPDPIATKMRYVGGPVLKTTDYRPRPWEYGLRLRKWVSKMVKG